MKTEHGYEVPLIDAFIRRQRFMNNWKNTADEAAMQPASIAVFPICLIWMAAALRIDGEWALWICGRLGRGDLQKRRLQIGRTGGMIGESFTEFKCIAHETLKNSKTLNPGRD